MTLENHINKLKKLTMDRDSKFSLAGEYFMTHIAENDEALDRSESYQDNSEYFQAVLTSILETRADKPKIISMRPMQIKPYAFVHSFVRISTVHPMVFYYFEEVQLGMAFISNFGGDTHFYRLSCFVGDTKTAEPIISSLPSKMLH